MKQLLILILLMTVPVVVFACDEKKCRHGGSDRGNPDFMNHQWMAEFRAGRVFVDDNSMDPLSFQYEPCGGCEPPEPPEPEPPVDWYSGEGDHDIIGATFGRLITGHVSAFMDIDKKLGDFGATKVRLRLRIYGGHLR